MDVLGTSEAGARCIVSGWIDTGIPEMEDGDVARMSTQLKLLADSSRAAPLKAEESLEYLVSRARAYAADSRAASTRKAYDTAFTAFVEWCRSRGFEALPTTPAVLALYLAELADRGLQTSTINRSLAGIVWAQRNAGHEWPRGSPPLVAAVMAGIRRRAIPSTSKAPVSDEELAALVGALGSDLAGLRDRAVLTMGWFGAFRRAELVALTTSDIERVPEGLIVTVRRSKGDQEARGGTKGIPCVSNVAICPVRALAAWLAAAGIQEGYVFRGVGARGRVSPTPLADKSVALIVQRTARKAGLDATRLAAHSLRAGFATTAAKRGKGLDAIMRQTLHRSERVARSYIRHASIWDDNAAVGLV